MKIISARRIREYAKVCAAHNRLEKLRYKIRGDMLSELDQGASPSTAGEFVLVRSEQHRIDANQFTWKNLATQLAVEVCILKGEDNPVMRAFDMILDAELAAARKTVPVLMARPNPTILQQLFGR